MDTPKLFLHLRIAFRFTDHVLNWNCASAPNRPMGRAKEVMVASHSCFSFSLYTFLGISFAPTS